MSFVDLQDDIERVLPSNGVVAFDPGVPGTDTIQVVPENFDGPVPTNGFARLGVIAPGGDINQFGASTERGLVNFSIFVDSGLGERRAYEAADAINALYQGKTSGFTQFRKGTITSKGIDSINTQLWRLDLRITFTRYNQEI